MKKLIYSATTANKSAFPLFHPFPRPAFRRRNQRQQHDHRAVPHERGQTGLIQRELHADQPRRAQEQREKALGQSVPSVNQWLKLSIHIYHTTI